MPHINSLKDFARENKAKLLLIFILLLGISSRLYFSLSTPDYSSGESYIHIKQASYIRQNGLPYFYDNSIVIQNSIGHSPIVFFPFFDYFLALSSILFPQAIAFKIISNLAASSIVIVIFFISLEITQNLNVALISALISSFLPIYFSTTSMSVSTVGIAIPLVFLCLYFFMRSDKENFLIYYLGFLVLLSLSSTISLLLVLSLIIYLLFSNVSGTKIQKHEVELTLFSTLFVLWMNFIVYKKAILFHGPAIIWQNIPKQILDNYFSNMSILTVIYAIGIVPFLFGMLAIRRYAFSHEKKKDTYLFISFALSSAILLYLKLIPLSAGLIYLGMSLIVLTSQYLKLILLFLSKSKLSNYSGYFIFGLLLVFSITSVIPSFRLSMKEADKAHLLADSDAFEWLAKNSFKGDIILVPPEQASIMNFISGRSFVLSDSFLFLRDAHKRYDDITEIYTSPYQTNAVSLINKYSIRYIVVSEYAMKKFNIEMLPYAVEGSCITEVYRARSIIYESHCIILGE